MAVNTSKPSREHIMALTLVFLSGFAALVYQILWMKQIGILFGNTSHAAAATLTSFFAGIAAGSWVLGKRVSRSANPMRLYAYLELGIAVTALMYFLILNAFHAIYPTIHQLTEPGFSRLALKFALSLLLVFPPAFCMGGTIPVMGQFLIRKTDQFGSLAALMYGINTLGAAVGICLAGFFLPLWLGFDLTCGLAIAISLIVALIAWRMSQTYQSTVFQAPRDVPFDTLASTEKPLSRQERRQRQRSKTQSPPDRVPEKSSAAPTPAGLILLLSFLSGFSVIALEVIWNRLFSQVLENSVYTFSAILLVVLVCLALGAIASSLLSRLPIPPRITLSLLLIIGAASVASTPWIFLHVTDGMKLISSTGTWSAYLLLILGTATISIAPAAFLLGILFPFLMKTEEAHLSAPGRSLGRLSTVNTIGAILGSLITGFLLLDWMGMWRSMQLIAWLYALAAIILPVRFDKPGILTKAASFAVLIGILLAAPAQLPVTSTDPLADYGEVIEVWEGSDCTVSVTEGLQGRSIRINSHYSLGSTGAYMQERFQADLPLILKPDAKDVFFLGVGTGITAGSALDPKFPNVRKVVACELVPEVITAARKHMTDLDGFDSTSGLFTDPRARVIVDDGRHYLAATTESFDIINADLFVPFRSGAGSLYSKEHFENCRDRLNKDGIFVQWLPLYQLTSHEFHVISHTMLEVFGQVSLWRHNFQPGDEVVALIGHENRNPLPAVDIDSAADKQYAIDGKTHLDLQQLNLPLNEQTILLFYCGNLTESRSLYQDAPINTDNHPVIEYTAPRSYRKQGLVNSPWFVGDSFAQHVSDIQKLRPPSSDPILSKRSVEDRRLPVAGLALHRARVAEAAGDADTTRAAWDEFRTEWTNQ